MAYDETAPLTINNLSLQEAYVLDYWWRRGLNTNDHKVGVREAVAAMETREPHPFAPISTIDNLAGISVKNAREPAMLRFRDGQSGENRYYLPMRCYTPDGMRHLYQAINEAEERHNREIDEVAKHNAAVQKRRDSGMEMNKTGDLKRPPWPGEKVELTPMPDADVGGPLAGAGSSGGIATLREGDCVPVKGKDGSTTLMELRRDTKTGRLVQVPVTTADAESSLAPVPKPNNAAKAATSTRKPQDASGPKTGKTTPKPPTRPPGPNAAMRRAISAEPPDDLTPAPVTKPLAAAGAGKGHEPA